MTLAPIRSRCPTALQPKVRAEHRLRTHESPREHSLAGYSRGVRQEPLLLTIGHRDHPSPLWGRGDGLVPTSPRLDRAFVPVG